MDPKQRFSDAAFNNEPCISSSYITNYHAVRAAKHQLFDAANSNIPNKNVLNTAEATAASNIPSKISGEMFYPTIFLQYVKDKYENNSSYRKDQAIKIGGSNTISGRGNVWYVIVRGLVLRNDTVIPCSEIIDQHIGSNERGDSERIKPGDLVMVMLYKIITQKCYFSGMFNLVKESVECCLEGQSMKRKTDGLETMIRIVRMDIEMSVSEIDFRNSYHARSMTRLTICFRIRNSTGW